MKIGLHDAEYDHMPLKIFPNYALMKISAYHKSCGDSVDWWTPCEKFDVVYSSKVFDFTPENMFLPQDTVRGGTGYSDIPRNQELPPEIDEIFPDYTIYPKCDYAIGFTTRGCPNHCPWCVVPEKEGNIRPYREWRELVRHDEKKLILMDNNILACEHGICQLQDIIGSGYAIDLNQGMDARLVTKEIAEILARLRWISYIRFSCDQISQIEPIIRVVEMLGKLGVKPYRIFIYLLVTKDIENAAYRVEQLKAFRGINIYAQAERNESIGIMPNAMQLEFSQRYMYGGCFRSETWKEYCARKGFVCVKNAEQN